MILYNLFYRMRGIRIGRKVRLKGIPIMYRAKGAVVSIGDGVRIKSSFLSNLVGLYQHSIVVARTKGARISIGNNCGMSGVTIYARKSIEIGDNVLIGGNTKIIDNDFHPVEPGARLKNEIEKIGSKPISIGNNVFIGCNCLILKGAKIGDNSVIGAGSVVTGEIPADCVAAGNPAKVVKYFREEK